MVASYLDEEGLGQAAEAVRAEVGLEMDRRAAARALAVARERDILTGDWAAVDATVRAVVTGPTERRQGPLGGPPLNQMNVQAFLYALARQRYLERIDAGDTAGALALLRTSLKPPGVRRPLARGLSRPLLPPLVPCRDGGSWHATLEGGRGRERAPRCSIPKPPRA